MVWIRLLVAAALAVALVVLVVFLPPAYDFHTVFRPAVWSWLRGETIYKIGTQEHAFLNPPWMLVLLLPFALPPEPLGRALLLVFTAAVFAWALRSSRRRRVALVLTLVSFPSLVLAWNGQLEGISLLGICLASLGLSRESPWALSAGLVTMSTKPQQTLLVALFMLWHARRWSRRQWARVAVLPAAAAGFAVAGFGFDWLTVMADASAGYAGGWVNTSWAWRFLGQSSPLLAIAWSVGVGMAALLLTAGRARSPYALALIATANILASPYVATQHLVVPLVAAWPWLLDRSPWVALLVYATSLSPLARLGGDQWLSWLDFLFPVALMTALLCFYRQERAKEALCD